MKNPFTKPPFVYDWSRYRYLSGSGLILAEEMTFFQARNFASTLAQKSGCSMQLVTLSIVCRDFYEHETADNYACIHDTRSRWAVTTAHLSRRQREAFADWHANNCEWLNEEEVIQKQLEDIGEQWDPDIETNRFPELAEEYYRQQALERLRDESGERERWQIMCNYIWNQEWLK